MTLALVLDGSGFPKRSEVFAGNASEPGTLARMVGKLANDKALDRPTVVLDAGIATEENIAWLVGHHYHYVVVSRERQCQFNPDEALEIYRTVMSGYKEKSMLVSAMLRAGRIYASKGMKEEAIDCYERLKKIWPPGAGVCERRIAALREQ